MAEEKIVNKYYTEKCPPIPLPVSADAGKVLTVNKDGCPMWGEGGIGSDTIIKGEQTNIVGGYDREASSGVLFNGVVKPSDFVDANTLADGGGPAKAPKRISRPTTQYVAPITLATLLIPYSTVTGTINGVEVIGNCGDDLILYDVDENPVLIIASDAHHSVCFCPNYSIPSSDLVISLTQSVQSGPAMIPAKYLDLTNVVENIKNVTSKANVAQKTAEMAKSKADLAETQAENAKAAVNKANSEIRTQDLWFHSSETALDDQSVPYGIKIGSVGSRSSIPVLY